MFVGIDNGNSGGYCVLRPDGSVAGYGANPVVVTHTHKEIDVPKLLAWACSYGPCELAIEEPLHHAPSAQALRSMALNVGLVVGEARNYPAIKRVHRIEVRDWQKALLGPKRNAKDTKVRALAAAKKLWPEEKWLATPRSKVPHDGIVDAALIAFYLLHTAKHQ